MKFRDLAAVAFLALLANGPAIVEPARSVEGGDPAAFSAIRRMGRGVNILGYDGVWEGGVNAPFRAQDFALIRKAGFTHVRINFFGFRYMSLENRIDPTVLVRLDRIIEQSIRDGLTPVLDQHDNQLCQSTPEKCGPKLVAFWDQIAAHYAGAHPQLIFEILNEPGGAMSHTVWNAALRDALAVIRAHDAARFVIVAALNNSAHDIENLDLPPADRRLIVTAHYYLPFTFTHQGAPWSPRLSALHDVDWGSEADKARVIEDFSLARDWASKHDRPLYLGEFGVYEKAPISAREAWMRHVAKTAESYGWSWAYWQFDHDFSLFDSSSHSWRQPLLDALMR
jgi:endoglucanase